MHISTLLMVLVLSLAGTLGVASAQSAPATLVGHLMWCKLTPQPVEQPATDASLLADVTPGMAHAVRPPMRVPASDVQVSIRGTSLSATTDGNGGFTLSGVPTAQPLTFVATVTSGPPLVLSNPNLILAAGETRDLGAVGLAGCGDGGAVLTVEPAPATDETADPALNTDGSN